MHKILLLLLICHSVLSQRIVVAKDGSGQYKSIQEAIDNIENDDANEKVIFIKSGVYEEKIFLSKNNVKLIGETQPTFGKSYSEWQKISNPKNLGVVIKQAIARDLHRCDNIDDWGAAVINIKANDISLENLTVINSFGFDLKEEYTFLCQDKSIEIKKDGHQFALRAMTPTQRLKVTNCNFYSLGGDTVSPWDVENGSYAFKHCTMEGGVDFYCPRGWAYAEDMYFICHNKSAAIWHDGSLNKDAKSVIKNATFVGDQGYKLGRFHKDAQLYLVNCHFSKEMADSEIYQVATQNIVQWGKRIYYYNCSKDGQSYTWYEDNISKSEAEKACSTKFNWLKK
jgi:pectinesterase